jgi:hypothetical protein
MASVVRVRINESAVRRVVDGSTRGMLTRYGVRVANRAASLTRSRRVASAIESRVEIGPGRREVRVGTFKPGIGLALWEHEGTRPHSIGSSVFIEGVGWRFIGRSRRGRGRIHPGTKRHPFLTDAMRGVQVT